MAESILIIDDEILTLKNLKRVLSKEGYEVLLADSGETGIEIFRKNLPNLVIIDLMLPGIDGVEVLKQIKITDENTVVIMITAYEILEKAVQSMKMGAYDYLLKPFKIDELKTIVKRALELQSLKLRVSDTVETEKGRYYFDRIIAKNLKMIEVLNTARKVAMLDKTSIFIFGESGVGKGLLARAIHYNSARAGHQFIEINCAAIPDTLLESELFGYEPGAFTDARQRKIGLMEKANNGTLFMDEIGDMSLPIQAKLLKVLEEQSFTRLGSTELIKTNVRIITASNKDLKKAINSGEFREDLFYRLNVVPIMIPCLRERKEDIIPLILNFINRFNKELHRSFKGITKEAAITLQDYEWPGNVRELRNIVERILALHQAEEIALKHLPYEIRYQVRSSEMDILKESVNQEKYLPLSKLEEKYIKQVLKYTNGNKLKAAKILGIHVTSLYRKLKSIK